jgi:hypothetical protein
MAEFSRGNLIPWVWNPEDGTRKLFPVSGKRNELNISLGPLESMLLVFDTDRGGEVLAHEKPEGKEIVDISGPWKAEFRHCDGTLFNRTFEELKEFGTSDDRELNSFAGTVKYLTEFESNGQGKWLSIDNVNRGVTELYLNGKSAGINWYGKPLFRIDSLLQKGINRIEIRYTTILCNWAMTLKDNRTAMQWTKGYDKSPMGIDGKVQIIE